MTSPSTQAGNSWPVYRHPPASCYSHPNLPFFQRSSELLYHIGNVIEGNWRPGTSKQTKPGCYHLRKASHYGLVSPIHDYREYLIQVVQYHKPSPVVETPNC